jgi:hypothetical protein
MRFASLNLASAVHPCVRCADPILTFSYRVDGVVRVAPAAPGVRSLLPGLAGRACTSMTRASLVKCLNGRENLVDQRQSKHRMRFI